MRKTSCFIFLVFFSYFVTAEITKQSIELKKNFEIQPTNQTVNCLLRCYGTFEKCVVGTCCSSPDWQIKLRFCMSDLTYRKSYCHKKTLKIAQQKKIKKIKKSKTLAIQSSRNSCLLRCYVIFEPCVFDQGPDWIIRLRLCIQDLPKCKSSCEQKN